MAKADEAAAAKKAEADKKAAQAKAEADKKAAEAKAAADKIAASAAKAKEREAAKAAKDKERAAAKAAKDEERAKKKAEREAAREARKNAPRAPRPPKPWEDLDPGAKQKAPRAPSVAHDTLELMKTNKGATLEDIQNTIGPKHKARGLLSWMNKELGYGFVMTKTTQKIQALAPNLIVPAPKADPKAA